MTDPTEVTILRLVRGRVRPGELDAYIEEARLGTAADMAGRDGPCGLYLATEAEDAFVTLSMWPSWDGLLAATGGDYRRPVATRHAERLVSWDAEHFEALPGLPVAPTRADAPV